MAAVYVFGWKSKGVYSYKLLTIILQGAFLPNIEYFGSKIGIQSNYTPVIVDQKNESSKIVNNYVFYNLNSWQNDSLRN